MNSVPKTEFGQITIPYYKNQNSKVITKIIPYYMSVRKVNKACYPPKIARPTAGLIVGSKSFFNKYKFITSYNKSFMKELLEKNVYTTIIKELMYAPYNMALLLKALNTKYKDLKIERDVYINTIENLSAIRNNPQYKTINNLLTNGRLSIVSECTGGHIDNYTGSVKSKDESFLESKITLCSGKSTYSDFPINENKFVDVRLPSGSLCYSLFGVYTNCCPLMDIECHALQDVVHLSSKNETNYNRGAVVLELSNKNDKNPIAKQWYYENGVAITYVPTKPKVKL